MVVIKVNIKWGKEKFDNVELDLEDSAEVFMAQVFALSGVAPEKQKLLVKGKTIRADTNIASLGLKDGASLILMGGAEALAAPTKPQVFLEDLSEQELSKTSIYPPGLRNLGNTCYLNATVQLFRGAPELETALLSGSFRGDPNGSRALAQALAAVYRNMKDGGDSLLFATNILISVLRANNPRFAEESEGHPAQQDASECWGELMRALSQSVPGSTGASSMIDQLFGIKFATKMTCVENPEDVTYSEENALQLSCHIEKDVGYMISGVKHALQNEKLVKHSAILGRDVEYTKSSLISRLPGYLTVGFVRFYFKREQQTNCKIIKDVKFPFSLDVFELCSPELQAKLTAERAEFAKFADYQAEQAQKLGKAAEVVPAGTALRPYSFAEDPNSSNSGYYDLVAVLTHRGRASNSGHYVCWRRLDEKKWLLFDDDTVTEKTREDVEKLSGGGADWHTAYILLYAPRRIPVLPSQQP